MADFKLLAKTEDGPRIVNNTPLESYRPGIPFDMVGTGGATVKNYRFIECSALINGYLKIWQYAKLPEHPYTTVSHVWDGVGTRPGDKTLEIKGKGGIAGRIPINLSVLQDACYAALKRNVNLLWIDRICIIQSEDDDIKWHFTVMRNIYKYCAFCLVIPGGLAQLTALNEETPWINRGWTLQEAVAPNEVQVMFAWEGDEAWVKPHMQAQVPHYITQVTKGRSAMAPLGLILDCSISGSLFLLGERTGSNSTATKVDNIRIFGASPSNRPSYKDASPNIAMLAAAISPLLAKDEDRVFHCLWKCMLMRATRYPADMVFSVMGLFGVKLDPSQFDQNDFIKPAIALAQELLSQGKPATWLGASFLAPPCPQLSTFPTFPTDTEGLTQKPLILVQGVRGLVRVEARSLMENEFVGTDACMPVGKMDKQGYFDFERISVPVRKVADNDWKSQVDKGCYLFGPNDDDVWWMDPKADQECKRFAVFLGFFCSYSPVTQLKENRIRAFIIESHTPKVKPITEQQTPEVKKYHVLSYVRLTEEARNYFEGWKPRKFSVGGPDSLGSGAFQRINLHLSEDEQSLSVSAATDEEYIPNSTLAPQACLPGSHMSYSSAIPIGGPGVANAAVNVIPAEAPLEGSIMTYLETTDEAEAGLTLGIAEEPTPVSWVTDWSHNAQLPTRARGVQGQPQPRGAISGSALRKGSEWTREINDTWSDSAVDDIRQQLFKSGSR